MQCEQTCRLSDQAFEDDRGLYPIRSQIAYERSRASEEYYRNRAPLARSPLSLVDHMQAAQQPEQRAVAGRRDRDRSKQTPPEPAAQADEQRQDHKQGKRWNDEPEDLQRQIG